MRVDWYQDNFYTRVERPLESSFVITRQEAAEVAAANVDLIVRELVDVFFFL